MSSDSINLGAVCGPMPRGGELASGEYQGSLTIDIEALLSWSGPMVWGLRITKPRATKSGRRGKPEPVILVKGQSGETVPEMLRKLALAWEQGDVQINALE